MRTLVVFLVSLIVAFVLALRFGTSRFTAESERLSAMLSVPSGTGTASVFHPSELDFVPPPVARYFRNVLREGQPVIERARIQQEGEFRMSENPDSWKPFSAEQTFRGAPPGFVWDARIRMAPGLPVLVRDSYDGGRGTMHAAVVGLVSVASASGTSEIATAALQRYLAEAVWFPTALLPSQGVVWSPVDATSALATLTDGEVRASLQFRFGDDGEIVGVFAHSRYREVEGAFVATPWEGVFRDYGTRSGMKVPGYGEVAWILEGERQPYWRGRILDASYDFRK